MMLLLLLLVVHIHVIHVHILSATSTLLIMLIMRTIHLIVITPSSSTIICVTALVMVGAVPTNVMSSTALGWPGSATTTTRMVGWAGTTTINKVCHVASWSAASRSCGARGLTAPLH